MRKFAVAIDGPAGSGKSTIAKKIAEQMRIIYVDTGAMYRAVAYYCISKGIDTTGEKDVAGILGDISMDIKQEAGEQIIYLNGEIINDKIRTQEVGQGASDVAVFLPVRQKLVCMQRKLAGINSVIMDGRDIGTNVLPDADIKIFLVASVPVRSQRRFLDYQMLGKECDFETVKEQIIARDKNDTGRKHNPLTQASDAIVVDSSEQTIEETVSEVMEIINNKLNR